uniref:Uncharacterized protein n=1 Tax=Noctiluca scintillans TaxID=2966 RepID=A0A7S0ZQP3_NOCSC|mmetsp:Transcript_1470/g.3997  ORF Transcript_1470/g.3997 Transcript_1470/m.3997 type:complete len:318 (+) Transcript_1470:78-1031(+)|eukprot:CAMPEP_0194518198 /NCGR_PEP_ID=MMETSP0253-20130528/51565_1 /TAXON_ID=2966 /ORGANISM="Noctiluca scintillans" /LENGTH=317 /DNA_ID=CAMNT_0039362225 /DNA_START=44 /DNA_END=997 /DNA_ORIENTATION=-
MHVRFNLGSLLIIVPAAHAIKTVLYTSLQPVREGADRVNSAAFKAWAAASDHAPLYASALANIATSVVFLVLLRRLYNLGTASGQSARRRLYSVVAVSTPLMLSVARVVAIMDPQASGSIIVATSVLESSVFLCVVLLLFDLVGATTKDLGEALEMQLPRAQWVVGPIRWLPCWSERRFTLMDVAVVNFMVGQFVFSYPVFECLEVHLFTHDFVIPIFLSMGLALYSVLAFLEGAHECLEGTRCHAKFWLVKVCVIVNRITVVAVPTLCQGVFDAETIVLVSGALFTFLCIPLAFFALWAFPIVGEKGEGDEKIADD